MDYRYPRQLVPADGQALVEQMDRFVERRGEPMLSAFSPEEFAVPDEACWITSRPEEQVRRYLQGRRDIPDPPPNSLSPRSTGPLKAMRILSASS